MPCCKREAMDEFEGTQGVAWLNEAKRNSYSNLRDLI